MLNEKFEHDFKKYFPEEYKKLFDILDIFCVATLVECASRSKYADTPYEGEKHELAVRDWNIWRIVGGANKTHIKCIEMKSPYGIHGHGYAWRLSIKAWSISGTIKFQLEDGQITISLPGYEEIIEIDPSYDYSTPEEIYAFFRQIFYPL